MKKSVRLLSKVTLVFTLVIYSQSFYAQVQKTEFKVLQLNGETYEASFKLVSLNYPVSFERLVDEISKKEGVLSFRMVDRKCFISYSSKLNSDKIRDFFLPLGYDVNFEDMIVYDKVLANELRTNEGPEEKSVKPKEITSGKEDFSEGYPKYIDTGNPTEDKMRFEKEKADWKKINLGFENK